MAIGERLRMLREAKGRSRGSVAARLHVSVSCIVMWELGHRQPPLAMADAYLRELGESIVIGVPQ